MSNVQPSTGDRVPACVPAAEPGSAVSSTNGCDGAAQSISSLIFLVQKLNIDMRDMERQFASKMQDVVFDRQVAALQMKREAILKNFDASIVSAAGQIAAGVLSVGGSASGSISMKGLAEGGGKSIEGIEGMQNAELVRDAKETQMDGEIQEEWAKQFERSLEQAIGRANEASHQLVQTTTDLVALQGRISEAVRF
jgi:secreted effector protein SseD